MQPLIAIKSIPELERLNSLKRHALLFDSFYATQHFEVTDFPAMRAYASEEARATFDFLLENEILKLPPKIPRHVAEGVLDQGVLSVMHPYAERIIAHFASPTRKTAWLIHDVFTRIRTFELERSYGVRAVPILNRPPSPSIASPLPPLSEVLAIGLDYLPVPGPSCSWENILDARTELHDKLWAFRRFLNGLASTVKTEPEVRDEIEWSLNEYKNALKLRRLKTTRSALELFVIPPIAFAENLVKFNWSKIAKGALSIRTRKIELMEAEMNAPGREVAYVFETQRRFRQR